MVRWLGVVPALALVLASGAEARAQMGAAVGQVVDENRAPVMGATVQFTFIGEIQREVSTRTDAKGRYTQSLPSGRYRITVKMDGYQGTYLDQGIPKGAATDVPTLKIVSRGKLIQDAMAPILKEFDKATELSKAGKLDEAMAVYRELEAKHPDMPQVHYNIGTVYVRQEKWPEAAAALQKAVELDAHNTQARVLLATTYQQLGRTDEALAAMEKLKAENPENPRFHYEIGVLHLNAKRYDEAFAAFEEVRKTDPANVDVLYLLGTISLNLGQVEQAAEYLESYLARAPADGQHRDTASKLLASLRPKTPASP